MSDILMLMMMLLMCYCIALNLSHSATDLQHELSSPPLFLSLDLSIIAGFIDHLPSHQHSESMFNSLLPSYKPFTLRDIAYEPDCHKNYIHNNS